MQDRGRVWSNGLGALVGQAAVQTGGIVKLEELYAEVDRYIRKSEVPPARFIEMRRRLKLAVDAIIWMRNRAEDPSPYGPAHVLSEVRKKASKALSDIEGSLD